MQKGVRNEEAAERAWASGLLVVADYCMMEETRRLIAEGILSHQRSNRVTKRHNVPVEDLQAALPRQR